MIGWALGGWKGAGAAVGLVALSRAVYRNRQQPVVSNYYIVQKTETSPEIDYELLAKVAADELELHAQERALEKLKQDNKEKFQDMMSRLIDQRDSIADTLGTGENVCYALCGSYGSDGVLRAKSVTSRSYDKEEGFENLLNQCGNKSMVFWDLRDATGSSGSYQHLMLGYPEAVCRTVATQRADGTQGKQRSRGNI